MRDPNTILSNFNYLINRVNLTRDKILKIHQLLSENPDAFAKKMRILKLEILALKRTSIII